MVSIFDKVFDKLSLSFSFLNRDRSPSNKAVIKGSPVGSLQQAGGDIHNVTISQDQRARTRPRVDLAAEFGGSGGSNGYFVIFKVINDGGEAALDVQGEFMAGDLPDGYKFDVSHNLSPSGEARITYQYDGTDLQNRLLTNPKIIFRYKAADGRTFESGRNVIQSTRVDGRYDIHQKVGAYFEVEKLIDVDIDEPRFNPTVRLQGGLADSFSVTVPVILKNRSSDSVLVRNLRQSLEMPDGYHCYLSHDGLNSPDGRNIAGRAVLTYNLVFAVSIRGRQIGVPTSQTLEWEANKDKLLASISSSKITFRFSADAVAPETSVQLRKDFDLTTQLLPQIKN